MYLSCSCKYITVDKQRTRVCICVLILYTLVMFSGVLGDWLAAALVVSVFCRMVESVALRYFCIYIYLIIM